MDKDYIKEFKSWLTSNGISFQIVYEKFEIGKTTIAPHLKTESGYYFYFIDEDVTQFNTENEIIYNRFVHDVRRCKGLIVIPKDEITNIKNTLSKSDVESKFNIVL